MSTIKSSNEHLTLNADGSGKDIKFQSNGSEVASISDGGVVTATTFTGAATDATKLPLAGGAMTGNVTLTTGSSPKIKVEETGGSYIEIEAGGSTGHIKSKSGHDITFSPGGTNHLQLYSSGRAKSQFTARAWINFDGYVSTPNIRDSHNISSITDNGTGLYTVNFTNNMANANYCVAGLSAGHDTGTSLSRNLYHKGYDALATGSFGLQVLRGYDANPEDAKLITAVVFGD